MGKLTSWLTRQEPISAAPVLDKGLVFLHKIIYLVFYLVLRFSLRIALGRKRRDRVFAKKGLKFHYEYNAVPSLSIIKFLYAVAKFFRLANNDNPFLLKIKCETCMLLSLLLEGRLIVLLFFFIRVIDIQ